MVRQKDLDLSHIKNKKRHCEHLPKWTKRFYLEESFTLNPLLKM